MPGSKHSILDLGEEVFCSCCFFASRACLFCSANFLPTATLPGFFYFRRCCRYIRGDVLVCWTRSRVSFFRLCRSRVSLFWLCFHQSGYIITFKKIIEKTRVRFLYRFLTRFLARFLNRFLVRFLFRFLVSTKGEASKRRFLASVEITVFCCDQSCIGYR